MVATPKVVDATTAKRLSINLQQCEDHWQRLQQVDLQHKLQTVFIEPDFPAKNEAEQQLYGGFLPNRDKPLLDEVRAASLEDFKQHEFYFSDQRYNKLLFSYKARYFPQALSADEQSNWLQSCRQRLTHSDSGYLTLDQQYQEIDQLLKDSETSNNNREILYKLEQWRLHVATKFAIDDAKNGLLK